MKRIVTLALALAAAALGLTPAADAATSTTSVALSPSAYTDLGAGPMLLGANGGAVIYQIADSQPAASSAGLIVQQGAQPINLSNVSAHVWAIASSSRISAVVSAGTGVTSAASGGGAGGSVDQGTKAAASAAWPFYLVQGTTANSLTNPIFINPATGATFAVSGTVATTAADGSNVAIGAIADLAWSGSGSGSLVALQKAVYAQLVALNTAAGNPIPVQGSHGVNIGAVEGVSAPGATPTEYPLYGGARAATAWPTALTDGQKVALMGDKYGRSVNVPFAPTDLWTDNGGVDATGVSSAITIISASGSASLKEYLKTVHCSRDDAGTTAIRIDISDGTKHRYMVVPNSGGGGQNNEPFDPPVAFAANTAITATPSASVSGNISCDGGGYLAP